MLLFKIGFLTIRFLDIIDILLVGLLIYFLYKLVRGTIAFNIFLGFLSIYLFWLMVEALNMQLLTAILGQFISVGVIALLIVFQQEIRRFLLLIGKNSFLFNKDFNWKRLLPWNWKFQKPQGLDYGPLVEACKNMARARTGALIVIAKTSELRFYASTGTPIDSEITTKLIESIFNKRSPLHDGAMIIVKNRIKAASCILPVSDSDTINPNLGTRHRAAVGVSEQTDALAIVVSEERGTISVARNGQLSQKLNAKGLQKLLEDEFYETVSAT